MPTGNSLSRVGLSVGCGLLFGDLLYSIDGVSVSNFGEVWSSDCGVSLNVFDVLSRLDWDGVSVLSVCRLGGLLCDVSFSWMCRVRC